MNTKHLISFITAAQNKSLSKAASILNYSQSTIYEHISALEAELKTELYQRMSKGIVLTPKGDEFYSYAMQMVLLYDETVAALSTEKQEIVRIAASETSDTFIMNKLIKKYLKRYPDVKIEYNKMTTDISIPKVENGHCDVAFVCETALNSNEVNARLLCAIPFIFVVQPNHPAVKSGISRIKRKKETLLGTMTLANAKIMLSTVGLIYEDLFDSLTVISGFALIKELILNEQAIALLPLFYVQEELDAGILARIPGLDHVVILNVYIVTQKRKRLSQAAQDIISLAKQMYSQPEIPF